MVDWLVANREWLFSGALVAIPIAVIGWVAARKRNRGSQVQRSGRNSLNVQAGGDINIGRDMKNDGSDAEGR